MEYIIDTKSNKIKFNILQNRSLSNKNIKQIDEKGLMRLNFNLAGIPNFSDFSDYDSLNSEYSMNGSVIKNQQNFEIGSFETKNDNAFLDLDIYSEERPKTMKGLGIISILEQYTVNAIYKKMSYLINLKNSFILKNIANMVLNKKRINYLQE